MEFKKERRIALVAVALFFLLLVVLYYPVDGSFEAVNFAYLFATTAFAGSVMAVLALTDIPAYYLIPVFFLYFLNRHAVAVGIWAVLGLLYGRKAQKNLIKPSLKLAVKEIFGTAFTLMALVSALLLYPVLKFEIPQPVMDMAVDLTLNMYGSALPCSPDESFDSCVDKIYSDTVAEQCKGDAACIALMKTQESAVKEKIKSNLQEQFPGFEPGKTLRDALKSEIEKPLEDILLRYENSFKIIAIIAFIFTFQFIGKLAELIAVPLAAVLFAVIKKAGLVREKSEKVDKIIYEV